MKHLFPLSRLAVAAAFAGACAFAFFAAPSADAAPPASGHDGHAMHGSHSQGGMSGAASAANATSAAESEFADGVVKKIDKTGGRVTVAHGTLKNLGMPPMTMVFRVKDPAWLDQMRVDDKIRFAADAPNGVLTIVRFLPENAPGK